MALGVDRGSLATELDAYSRFNSTFRRLCSKYSTIDYRILRFVHFLTTYVFPRGT